MERITLNSYKPISDRLHIYVHIAKLKLYENFGWEILRASLEIPSGRNGTCGASHACVESIVRLEHMRCLAVSHIFSGGMMLL